MQFLTSLLGGSSDTIVTSALLLGAVIILIALGLWILKFSARPGIAMRSQGRRMQVVDQMQVDAKRQLLIVRRDNVEHLILTGGPQDLVVESGIPVAEKAPLPSRRPQPAASMDEIARSAAEPAQPAALRPHIERLRDFGRPEARSSNSLRHTGLLRPVSVMEPAVIPMPPIAGDNSGRGRMDSAPNAADIAPNRQTALGAQVSFSEDGTADHR